MQRKYTYARARILPSRHTYFLCFAGILTVHASLVSHGPAFSSSLIALRMCCADITSPRQKVPQLFRTSYADFGSTASGTQCTDASRAGTMHTSESGRQRSNIYTGNSGRGSPELPVFSRTFCPGLTFTMPAQKKPIKAGRCRFGVDQASSWSSEWLGNKPRLALYNNG